ncbi:MAG TPA: phosphohistidine phosphatase SixA [Chthoniobacterales bacterium]|nr:phosphohistidine phosphatase SixA [Chthoniobacterales bacterium]
MRVYFLRHGEADWPNWDRSDDERPLTERGKKEMRKVAKFLRELDVPLEEIVSSPLLRARQTADAVADRFQMQVREHEFLAGGFNVSALQELIRKFPVNNLMLVGHEPSFSEVIEKLTGGNCKMSKGGVALVELDGDDMSGRLLWLFPPKIAKVL